MYNDGEILHQNIFVGLDVKNGIFQFTSASRRAAFETSIRQMVAPFGIFWKCAGSNCLQEGDRLTPGGRHAPGYPIRLV